MRCALLTVALFAPIHAQTEPRTELLGNWQAESGTVLRLETERCSWRRDGEFRAFLARYEPGEIRLNFHGQSLVWSVRLEDDTLHVRSGRGKPTAYTRLEAEPDGFEVAPLELGKERLRRTRLKQLQSELVKRARKDQQLRNRSNVDEKKLQKLDRDNTEFLREQVREYGWVDVKRFGESAADAAWTLVIHSGDLPLMLAALQSIEKEPRAKKLNGGENYANLSDRTRMSLGQRQRYGTQIVQDARGESLVYPLEDPERVDRYRKQLGMQSFDASLEMQSRWLGRKPRVQTEW